MSIVLTIVITVAATILSIAFAISVPCWFDFKKRLQKDIERLLVECREADNWDEKSESKLFQWMEGVEEDELYNCSLLKLRKIRSDVSDYLYIHVYGRDPVPDAGPIESLLQNWADRLRYRRQTRVRQKNTQ